MRELYVNYPWIPDRSKLYKLFDDILNRRELTNNKKYVRLLEKKLIENTKATYAFATGNGTLALQIAIRSLNITNGEIITTPHSFIASTSSILWQNCKPVFVDIDLDTLCINSDLIEKKITERTKAILAVHIYGNVCNIEAIEHIARKYNLPTIYDGSHAFGVTFKNKSVFNFGTISTVSFHASKIVSAVEGGAIFCGDKELAEIVYKMRYFGKNADNEEEIVGINGKMDEFNAAFGLLSLSNLEDEILARNAIANRYIEAFSEKKEIHLLKYKHNTKINFSYFPIILPKEKDVLELLHKGKEKKVSLKRILYPSLSTLTFLHSSSDKFPVSDSISDRILCIPINGELTVMDQKRIVDVVMSL